jgi:hypothetical protein
MFQITNEARLENGGHGSQAHRHRRELPEVRHQPRVRIRRQAAAANFLTEAQQLTFVQATLQIGTRIDAGSRVPLHEHHVAGMRGALGTPEMIEADLVQCRRGRIARDVAAIFRARTVGLHHHRQGIPPQVGFVAPLQRAVTGIIRLLRLGNGVEVRRVRFERQVGARTPCEIHELFQQKMRPLRSLRAQHRVDRLQPVLRLGRINVFERRLLGHKLEPWIRHAPMHTPTCPVKMARTLQRRCANCHLRFLSSAIFGVWFFTVKQGSAGDMRAICLRFN